MRILIRKFKLILLLSQDSLVQPTWRLFRSRYYAFFKISRQKNRYLQQLVAEINASANFVICQIKLDLHITPLSKLEKQMLLGRTFSRIWIAELMVAQFQLTFSICNLLQYKKIDDGFENQKVVSRPANQEHVVVAWYPCSLPVDVAFWLRKKSSGQSMPVE